VSKTSEEPTLMQQRFRGYLPVVVDVETGGFNAKTDALLEIAVVLVEMDDEGWLERGETLQYNIQPFEGANLEKAALEFTGIDPWSTLRDARPEGEALRELFQPIRRAIRRTQCKRAILVGHNATFDLGFLKGSCGAATRSDATPSTLLYLRHGCPCRAGAGSHGCWRNRVGWRDWRLITRKHTRPLMMRRRPPTCSASS